MTPAARLAAAADILNTLDLSRPVEAQLKAWGRGNRYAGSKDRRAIADRVFTALRYRRSAALRAGGETGRAQVLGTLAGVDGLSLDEIAASCTGGYALASLDEAESAALARIPDWPSEAARLDWPEWLWTEAQQAFEGDTERELDALRQRAPVDLRINTLRASMDDAIAALQHGTTIARDDIAPVSGFPLALRLPPGSPVLASRAWSDGMVELQDAGSQAVAAMTDAHPNETILDYCAGGGGKTLALGAAMENTGQLFAFDVEAARMTDLPQRAERAGVTCLTLLKRDDLEALTGTCDRVLVDAPCSGSGSWRRDPAGKWRLTPAALETYTRLQDDALAVASRYLRPGGTLLYATCSVLRIENEDRIATFLDHHPAFTLKESCRLHPARDGCDGFFAARLNLTGC